MKGVYKGDMSNDYKMYRCVILKETKEYIVGKDIFNKKIYHIKKNEETKDFKVGGDKSFYAIKEECGTIFKKLILNVVNYNSVIEKCN